MRWKESHVNRQSRPSPVPVVGNYPGKNGDDDQTGVRCAPTPGDSQGQVYAEAYHGLGRSERARHVNTL